MAKKKASPRKTGGAYKPKTPVKRGDTGKSFVAGKSIDDLLKNGSAHLHQYKESNLRAVVTRLASAANKRLRRAETQGLDSPAIRAVKQSGGKFSGKGLDLEGLKREFLRLKSFFRDPTSTQEGWKRTQEKARREAEARGVIRKETPKPERHPTTITPPEDFVEGGEYSDPEVTSSWTYDPETDRYNHPVYGKGWVYESQTGEYLNEDTGEVVTNPNAPRMYHDYDATADWRVTGKGRTETGDLWRMVDSLVKLDPSFSRQYAYGAGVKSARQLLFDAIDDMWVTNPGMTMEEARDMVAGQLDQIKQEGNKYFGDAAKIGETNFL